LPSETAAAAAANILLHHGRSRPPQTLLVWHALFLTNLLLFPLKCPIHSSLNTCCRYTSSLSTALRACVSNPFVTGSGIALAFTRQDLIVFAGFLLPDRMRLVSLYLATPDSLFQTQLPMAFSPFATSSPILKSRLLIANTYTVCLHRIYNRIVMDDTLARWHTDSDKQVINQCRLYLQVKCLSDICTADDRS
jgi:hypothetical protein